MASGEPHQSLQCPYVCGHHNVGGILKLPTYSQFVLAVHWIAGWIPILGHSEFEIHVR